jgi:dolichyl-phosphate beta-glucosyltransferase
VPWPEFRVPWEGIVQLIIPAYNEQNRLPATLKSLRAYALSTAELPDPPLEVLVVDNGSTDDTAAVAAAMSTRVLPIRVVFCAEPGKGAAVRAGMAASTADIVGFMDADGATDLSALAAAAGLLNAGADVVIGSRGLEESETEARHHWLRHAGAALYRAAAARLVPGIVDTQCGFKVLRGDLAREVFASVATPGFAFDVELLARCRRARARIEELPVIWADMPGSTFSPIRHGLRSFADLVSIGWRLSREPVLEPVTTLRPAAPVLNETAGSRLRLVRGA